MSPMALAWLAFALSSSGFALSVLSLVRRCAADPSLPLCF